MSTPHDDESIAQAIHHIHEADHHLRHLRVNIGPILARGTWRRFNTPEGEQVTHEKFADFLTAPAPRGLGSTPEEIRRLLVDDELLSSLLDRELSGD